MSAVYGFNATQLSPEQLRGFELNMNKVRANRLLAETVPFTSGMSDDYLHRLVYEDTGSMDEAEKAIRKVWSERRALKAEQG